MNPIHAMALFLFAIGAGFFFLSLWGRDPKHLGFAVGTLADSKRVMRYARRYSNKKVPVTTCVYHYQVGGKTYRLRREGRFGRSTLLRRVTVVYLKPFPRFGYLEKYPTGLFMMGGVVFVAYGILMLLFY